MKAAGADGGAGECSLGPAELVEAVRAMEELESKAQRRANGALPQGESKAELQAQSQGGSQGGLQSQGGVQLQGGSQGEGGQGELRGEGAQAGASEGEQAQASAEAPAISVASMPGAELLSDEVRKQSQQNLQHSPLYLLQDSLE